MNNEFENALQADGRRIWEVEKQFYNPDHPIARFGMGNVSLHSSFHAFPSTLMLLLPNLLGGGVY